MKYTKKQVEQILRDAGFESADTESVRDYLDEYDSYDNEADFDSPEDVVTDYLEYAQ